LDILILTNFETGLSKFGKSLRGGLYVLEDPDKVDMILEKEVVLSFGIILRYCVHVIIDEYILVIGK